MGEFNPDEEAWIAGELARDPRLIEATLRAMIRGRHRKADATAAIETAAAKAGVPVEDYRRALAERDGVERIRARRASLDRARRAVGVLPEKGAPRTGLTVKDVREAGELLRAPDGTGPTEEEVAQHLGCTVRWISTLCRDDGGYRAVVPARK